VSASDTDGAHSGDHAGTRASAPRYSSELRPGTQIGTYAIQQLRARAGFSQVYRAEDITTGAQVAVKLLRQELALSEKSVRRFELEFRALQKLRHPHIVAIFDYGELEDGRPYFVMEWLEGATLRAYLRGGAFTLEETLPIVEQLCAALAKVHELGVVHRDLKSSNIMLVGDGNRGAHVKLYDFGIAKPAEFEESRDGSLTTTGVCLGTPGSMAPEQILRTEIDARTDIYALGVLIYEMLTGREPFLAASSLEVVDLHLTAPPPRASDLAPVPSAVDEIIQRCMAKQPGERYDTAMAVYEALAEAASEQRASGPTAVDRAGHTVSAFGLHVDVDLLDDDAVVDDGVFDAIDDLVGRAKQEATAAGMRVAMSSGRSFLAIAPTPSASARSLQLREAMIRVALAVVDCADQLTGPAAPIRASVAVHEAPVTVAFANGATSFVGGDLLTLGDWLPAHNLAGVIATGAALRGVESRFAAEPLADEPDRYRVLHSVD
jgi:eukaryotic-like serine/threonine-protein kinase